MIRNRRCLLLITVLLVSTVLSVQGCNCNADNNNSKLDFNIKRLIEAEEQGEVEEFARQRSIELINGSVTVIIECESGQAEAVAEAANEAGAEQVMSDSKRDLVQVVVPIGNLNTLAEIPGVILVRLPIYPVENE